MRGKDMVVWVPLWTSLGLQRPSRVDSGVGAFRALSGPCRKHECHSTRPPFLAPRAPCQHRHSQVRSKTQSLHVLPSRASGLLGILALFLARCAFSPFTLVRLDFWGDGVCSEEESTFVVNHGCASGVPHGFMVSHSLGDALVIGCAMPVVMLECVGRSAIGQVKPLTSGTGVLPGHGSVIVLA